MCQLNVYMIDKFVSGLDVKEIFNKHHHKTFENINEEIELKDFDDKYNYYEASAKRCDCGSVVGLLRDYKGKFQSYTDYLASMEKQNVVNLYKIKDLLSEVDYQSKLDNVLNVRDRMFLKLEDFTKDLKDREVVLSELTVKTHPNLQDQIMIKKLTQEIDSLKKSLNDNPEYKMAELSYNDFIKQNELLIASRNYTLDYKKDWWQENIDLKISKVEHENHIHTNAEFNHLKFILGDVLKLTDEVKLFSICQEDDSNYDNLNRVKDISLNDLKLEDLIFLDHRDVVTIKR